MNQDQSSSNSWIPDEIWAHALAAFERFLEAAQDEQLAIRERIKQGSPQFQEAFESLLRRHAAESTTGSGIDLEIPALLHVEAEVADPLEADFATSFRRGLRPTSALSRAFLAVATCSLLLYGWVGALVFHFGEQTSQIGWTATWTGGPFVVTEVAPDGPAAGLLRAGDQITAVNGDPRFSSFRRCLVCQ